MIIRMPQHTPQAPMASWSARSAVCLAAASALVACATAGGPVESSAPHLGAHLSHGPPPIVDAAGAAEPPAGGANLTVEGEALFLRVRVSHGMLPPKGGMVAVRYDFKAPPPTEPRAPIAVAFVFDRSTSMAEGDKLARTLEAGRFLIRNLGPHDRVALISFADDVRVVMPIAPAISLSCLEYGLDGIHADGNTNISGGLLEGFAQVLDESFSASRRHLILLTDGLANRGVTNRSALAVLAGDQVSKGATLSTIGVGADFDEPTLTSLATIGRGTFHHISDAAEISDAFRKELGALKPVAAQNISLELRWTSPAGAAAPRPVRIAVGDLYAEDALVGVKVLEIPRTPAGGSHRLEAVLIYDDPRHGRTRREVAAELPVVADAVTRDAAMAREVLEYARFTGLARRIGEGLESGDFKKRKSLVPEGKELYARLRDWAIRHGDQPLMNDVYMLHHLVQEMEFRLAGGSHGMHAGGSSMPDHDFMPEHHAE